MNEIQLYEKLNDPLLAIERLGTMFAKSGMFGCDRPEQGQVLAMICLAEKRSPVEVNRTYDIIDGKLRKKALAALADFRAAGGKHKWLATGDDGKAAEIELTYEGQTIKSRFTIDDAQRQGLIRPRSNWEKSPANMLRARAISNGVAMLAPEIFAGQDDVESMPAPAPALALFQDPAVEPKVVEVQVVAPVPPDTEKELAQMGLAPVKPAEPTPEPAKEFAKGPSYSAPTGNKLSDELVSQVEAAIGDQAKVAVAWMVKEGWIKAGQGLDALTEARAKRVVKQRDSFLRAIGGAK